MKPACLCCESGDTALLYPCTRSGVVWRCRACGFCFIHPIPDEAFFAELYSGPPGDMTYRARHKMAFREHLETVNRICPASGGRKPRLLDVGSGDGYFAEMAQERGYQAFGIDIAAHWLPSPRCCSADFQALPFPDKGFDVCTIWASLEHVIDPPAVISECRRVTVSGGFLLLSVPCTEAPLHGIRRSRWSQYIPGHLGFYTQRSLERLLGRYGYRVVWWQRTAKTSIAQALTVRGRDVRWLLANPLLRSVMLFPITNPISNTIACAAVLTM